MSEQRNKLVRTKLNMILKRRVTFDEIEEYSYLNKQILYLFWMNKINLDDDMLEDLYEVLKSI